MKKSLLFVLILVSFQSFAQDYGISSEDVPAGLAVGDDAPNFQAKTAEGETFDLSEALTKNAVALVFYRGYWCGYCSRALEAYADSLSYLTDIGIQVVAVTPETYDYVARTEDEANVNFTILSDTEGDVMRAFDVDFRVTDDYQKRVKSSAGKSLKQINDSKQAELPIPATYLIVRDGKSDHGTVVWRHFDPNYAERASVKQIRDALLSLD